MKTLTRVAGQCLIAAILVAGTVSCLPIIASHAGTTIKDSPAVVIARRKPATVEARLADGTILVLKRPTVANDSIIGQVDQTGIPGRPLLRRAIPVDSVASITVGNAATTFALVLGAAASVLLVVYLMTYSVGM